MSHTSKSKEINELFSAMAEAATQISLDRLKQLSSRDDVTLTTDVAGIDRQGDHWICSIEIETQGISLTFRTHFTTRVARHLARGILGSQANLLPDFCHSFISEYCNLAGGALRDLLSGSVTSHFARPTQARSKTLPEKAPSYDAGYSIYAKAAHHKLWRLGWQGGEVVCSVLAHIDDEILWQCFNREDPRFKKAIEALKNYQPNEGGEFDFL